MLCVAFANFYDLNIPTMAISNCRRDVAKCGVRSDRLQSPLGGIFTPEKTDRIPARAEIRVKSHKMIKKWCFEFLLSLSSV